MVACGKDKQKEVIRLDDLEPDEEEVIDMEQFRVEGDRLVDEPVISTLERKERFVKQYETVDRPVLLNTLRHLQQFDKDHEGAFKGVRLVTDKSIDEVKEAKVKEYLEHLGDPLNSDTTKIYDIKEVYPYTEDDFHSYYTTVVNILIDEVTSRTQTYAGIKSNIENQKFDQLKNSGIVRNFQEAIDIDGGLLEQVRPYIEEMDKLVVNVREDLEMERPKYTPIESDIEEVPDYIVPDKMTVQEIISIEPSSDLYEDYSEEPEPESEEEQESEE